MLGVLSYKRTSDGRLHWWSRRYRYSAEGDLVSVGDSLRGTTHYSYDDGHRLVGERTPSGRRLGYELDEAGNVLSKPGLGRAEVGEGNRLVATERESFEYDARNHLSVRRGHDGRVTRYVYDSYDMLVRVETLKASGDLELTVELEHDALGRLAEVRCEGLRRQFYWDGDRLAGEVQPDGSLRVYHYGSDESLVPLGFTEYESVDAAPESGRGYTVFSDPVGMPLSIEDDQGSIVWWASRVDPYGVIDVHPTSRLEYNLRWPGHYFDPVTGLHYNRRRAYDPVLGRYLQSDPVGYAGSEYNLYGYPSNPLSVVDVLGLDHEGHSRPNAEDGQEGTRRQSIADRIAEGGNPPKHARQNPDLYYFDTESRTYNRIPGEGHSRSSEYPSGYRRETWEVMITRHTDEGRAAGGWPRDADGNRIPPDQLTWLDANDQEIPFYEENGRTNLTFDHQVAVVDHCNDGATVTNPDTGQTITYPPGRDSSRASRADFYNDPNNLVPMSRPENSSKHPETRYNDNPTGPNYSN